MVVLGDLVMSGMSVIIALGRVLDASARGLIGSYRLVRVRGGESGGIGSDLRALEGF